MVLRFLRLVSLPVPEQDKAVAPPRHGREAAGLPRVLPRAIALRVPQAPRLQVLKLHTRETLWPTFRMVTGKPLKAAGGNAWHSRHPSSVFPLPSGDTP